MTVGLLPVIKSQFWGTAGAYLGLPLAGGKVYCCIPGGTISQLKDSYTDSTAATPNANPVVLDSNGMADIWLNGYYKVYIYDANNVLQYSEDNVSSASSSSGAGGGGSVNSVSGQAPVASSGGANPIISMPAANAAANGFMSLTYAAKLDGIAAGATNVVVVDSVSNTSTTAAASANAVKAAYDHATANGISNVSGTAPVSVANGNSAPVISMAAANATGNGFMSSTYAAKLDGISANATHISIDPIWTANGDLAVGTGSGTAVVLHLGANGQVATVVANTISWQTPATGGGTITNVTASAPVASSGGTTPNISMAAATANSNGFMTAAYATKLNSVPANIVSNVSGTAPVSVANGTSTPVVSMPAANANGSGYMTNTYAAKLDGIAAGATAVTLTDSTSTTSSTIAASATAVKAAYDHAGLPAGTVNVATYGALGDGTDQTTAIASAITAASNKTNYPNGCVVEFNNGTYLYSALTINVSEVGLKGKGHAGTRLLKTGTTGYGITFTGTNIGACIFRNSIEGMFLGQATTNASSEAELLLQYCQQFDMRDVWVGQFWYNSAMRHPHTGLSMLGCIYVSAIDIVLSDCLGHGGYFANCIDLPFVNWLVEANGTYGLWFQTCNAITTTNVEVGASGGTGIKIDKNISGIWPGNADANRFHYLVNTSSDSSGNHNWDCSDIDDALFVGAWGCTHSKNGNYHGFNFYNCIGVRLIAPIAGGNNGNGIYSYGTSEITIIGGLAKANGQYTSYSSGIRIDSGYAVINGTTSRDNTNIGNGLYIGSSISEYDIVGNRIKDNSTNVANQTTPNSTNMIFEHNVTS